MNFPPPEPWERFNSLQQLTYFITFFIAAPVQIATGLLQGPAFSNRLGWLGRVLNRQVAQSIHFLSFCWFVFFIVAHGVFVFITGLRQNTNHMFAGVESASWSGLPFFLLAMAVLIAAWLVATPFTIKRARLVQKTGRFIIGGLKKLVERWDPTSQLTERDISPHFWPNHHFLPNSPEYDALLAGGFADYRLRIGGHVEHPQDISFADLKAMPKQSQTPPISASRAGRGWQNGAAFRCVTSWSG